MRSIFLTMLLLVSASANAAPITIDFEEFSGETFSFPNPLYSKDYVIEQSEPNINFPDGYPGSVGEPIYGVPLQGDGGNVFNYCADAFCHGDVPPLFTLSTVNDNPFDLFSVDFAANNVGQLQVTGYYIGGGSISETIFADGTSWQTQAFGAGWSNLDRVEFLTPLFVGSGTAALDNIVVSTVPVPAAVWLFGSALAGLGWMRRRKTALEVSCVP
jgi:hypothetical protein